MTTDERSITWNHTRGARGPVALSNVENMLRSPRLPQLSTAEIAEIRHSEHRR